MTSFTSKQLRIIKTINLFLSYGLSGLAMTVVGATLLDLQHAVNTDTKNIAFVFVARSGGYLVGLLFGGPILDKTSRKLFVMTFLNFLIAISMFGVPLSGSNDLLLAWMVLNGMAIGALDTGLNVYCLNLWGKDSGPIFQAQTFAFGVGGLTAPLIVAPFLADDQNSIRSLFHHIRNPDVFQNSSFPPSASAFQNQSGLLNLNDTLWNTSSTSSADVTVNLGKRYVAEDNSTTYSTSSSSVNLGGSLNGFGNTIVTSTSSALLNESEFLVGKNTFRNFSSDFSVSDNLSGLSNTFQDTFDSSGFTIPTIFYGYAIIGSIALLVTILFLVVCIIAPVDDMAQYDNHENTIEQGRLFVGTIVFLTFLLLFVELGVQMGYGQVVATYAVKGPLTLSHQVGSYITSVYWSAFTLGRFTAIFFVLKFSNLSLILFSLLVTSAGALVLLFFSTENSLWAASVLVGFGVSPFFSAAIAWIEQYITITNKMVALFSTGYCFGEMVVPYVITHFMDETPEALSYMVAGSCVISVPLILSMYLLLRNKTLKYQAKGETPNMVCEKNGEKLAKI